MNRDIADLPTYIQNILIDNAMKDLIKYYYEGRSFNDGRYIRENIILMFSISIYRYNQEYNDNISMESLPLYIDKMFDALKDGLMYGYNKSLYKEIKTSEDYLSFVDDDIISPKVFNIIIYLSERNNNIISRTGDYINHIIEERDIIIIKDYDPIIRSWLKRWIVATKEALTKQEFIEKLEKMERAAELEYINLKQSNIDKSHAEGIAALIQSIQDVPSAILLVGSSLIVKQSTPNSAILVRTLSQKQLIKLEEHPSLLSNPDDIINALFGNHNPQKNDDNLLRRLIIDSD